MRLRVREVDELNVCTYLHGRELSIGSSPRGQLQSCDPKTPNVSLFIVTYRLRRGGRGRKEGENVKGGGRDGGGMKEGGRKGRREGGGWEGRTEGGGKEEGRSRGGSEEGGEEGVRREERRE